MFKSKSAILVLIWSFCGSTVFQSLYNTNLNWINVEWKVNGTVTLTSQDLVIACVFLYPIFGWLADTKYGRYKVIKWSFILLLMLTAIFCIFFVFQFLYHPDYMNKILLLWHVPMTLALGGIMANVIQFGTDQLYDASTNDIVSFIRWWTWVWTLGGVASALCRSCSCKHPSLASLYLPTVTTLAISFDFLFNSFLIKESPPTSSPLTTIVKVLCYALKHKYPMRIAPNDWDEERTARLDVGKRKYGGPFASEEVEDVKTCFRISAVLLVVSFFLALFVSTVLFYHDILAYLNNYNPQHCDDSSNCYRRVAIMYNGDITFIFAIPLFECISCPLFRRLSISILKRGFIGMFLAILSLMSVTTIVFVAQYDTTFMHNGTCSLVNDIEHSVDYEWMAIPFSLETMLQIIILTSGIEFITAQSPYYLKGLFFGMICGSFGFFFILGKLISFGIQLITTKWLLLPYGCTFWYLILVLTVFLILIVITSISFKCYKRRQREDPHGQLFPIDHYS